MEIDTKQNSNGMDREQVPSIMPLRADFKKIRVEEAIKRKKIKKILRNSIILGTILVLILGGIWYNIMRTRNLPGTLVSDQGREHIAITNTNHPSYNSNPPTSGPHFSQPSEWGVYKQELADETLIHNLEHGGVWISYKPGIPEEVRKNLENFYKKWGRKVIVTPRSKNDSDIALAAWNRLDKFSVSEYSEERVEKFIKAFRNKGPEFVP